MPRLVSSMKKRVYSTEVEDCAQNLDESTSNTKRQKITSDEVSSVKKETARADTSKVTGISVKEEVVCTDTSKVTGISVKEEVVCADTSKVTGISSLCKELSDDALSYTSEEKNNVDENSEEEDSENDYMSVSAKCKEEDCDLEGWCTTDYEGDDLSDSEQCQGYRNDGSRCRVRKSMPYKSTNTLKRGHKYCGWHLWQERRRSKREYFKQCRFRDYWGNRCKVTNASISEVGDKHDNFRIMSISIKHLSHPTCLRHAYETKDKDKWAKPIRNIYEDYQSRRILDENEDSPPIGIKLLEEIKKRGYDF